MSNKIEVEWKVTPQSGITEIHLSDLGCKNKKEWNALDKAEQEKRLNKALWEYDGGEIKILAKEW